MIVKLASAVVAPILPVTVVAPVPDSMTKSAAAPELSSSIVELKLTVPSKVA